MADLRQRYSEAAESGIIHLSFEQDERQMIRDGGKSMRAIKKLVEVDNENSITVRSLPFKPGSKVEVIVLPSEKAGDIFDFADKIAKKRKIAPLSLKEVEKIVHDVRRAK
jgi:hypothetical protein